MSPATARSEITDETPITLAEACDGKYTVDFLLQEASSGRLTTFKVGRRIFTTPAHMKAFESVTTPKLWAMPDKNFAGVYIVGFSGYLKIGWSDHVAARIGYIQQYLPENLTLYGIIVAPPRVEFIAHRRFASYRTRGEWFRNDGEIKEWATSWAGMQSR